MRIALVIPAGAAARSGNRATAGRWTGILRSAGHSVQVSEAWTGQPADLLLALHARRSHASIAAFHAACPGRPLILALTGTDVYRDIHRDRLAKSSLALASRFIVLQPRAALELPRELRSLARVVYQSCPSTLSRQPVRRGFRITVIGHLREEKDPLRAGLALAHVPRAHDLRVIQIGSALDPQLAARAVALQAREDRYRWLDGISHSKALRWLASSHAMVISSRMEGGANVVSEAIRIGVPVLASDISGNIGLLGPGYPGYFRVGDTRALAGLMVRVANDPYFLARLQRCIRALRPLVDPANEARMLLEAVTTDTRRRRA